MKGILDRLFWFSGWTYDFTKVATIFLLVGLLTHYFFFSLLIVRGKSMEPGFIDGDALVINKIVYEISTPKRGDVIAMYFPGETQKRFIKRIIGLPGETVKVTDGNVYINDRLLPEDYLDPSIITIPSLENKLGAGEYFVFGDNRALSSDSRAWGPVPKSFIIGQVTTKFAHFPSQED